MMSVCVSAQISKRRCQSVHERDIDGKVPIYRTDQTQNQSLIDEKIRVIPLFPFDAQVNCEIFIIELLPTCEHLSSQHKLGLIESVIVVDGTMEILLNGIWQTLYRNEPEITSYSCAKCAH